MKPNRYAPEPTLSVYAQPAPHGLWSGSNNFGSAQPFAPDANNRQMVLKLPEWGEPVVWTVSLGIDYSEAGWPEQPGRSRAFEVVAEVSFGVGGATQTVEVDWIQGTTFSAPMNAITVEAVYEGPLSLVSDPPRDLMLSVLVARGAMRSSIPPTRFAPLLTGALFASLANNSMIASPARIPPFAKRLQVTPLTHTDFRNLISGNNFVRFFSARDVTVAAFPVGAVRIDEAVVRDGVLVPPFAKYVTLQNDGGGLSATTRASFNFQLEL